MNTRLNIINALISGVAVTLIGMGAAEATPVLDSFTVFPIEIGQGQSATLQAVISAQHCCGNVTNDILTGGTLSFVSGDGQQPVIEAVVPGLTLETLTAIFTYNSAATFTPFVTGTVFDSFELTAPCGLFNLQTCVVGTDGSSATLGASALLTVDPIASVPEPASLALFGVGLAAFGVLRRRRKSAC